MQVFELHFNPKARKDKVFETFIYDPENLYEKRLGSLYMAGELEKQLLRNPRFLSELSCVIKNEYYGSQLKNTPDQNLKASLIKANDFLDAEAKKGNIDWLGNLNFAVLNYNDFTLNFTKSGDIKIILIKRGDFLDISENLEIQSDQAYPMKIFNNIASGKLAPSDKLLVLTKDAFFVFSQNGTLMSQLAEAKDEQSLKAVIKINKPLFTEISGVCLLISVSQNPQPKFAFAFKKELPIFSFRKFIMKPLLAVQKPLFSFGKKRIKIPQTGLISWNPQKIFLVVFLILLLALSFIFFRK